MTSNRRCAARSPRAGRCTNSLGPEAYDFEHRGRICYCHRQVVRRRAFPNGYPVNSDGWPADPTEAEKEAGLAEFYRIKRQSAPPKWEPIKNGKRNQEAI